MERDEYDVAKLLRLERSLSDIFAGIFLGGIFLLGGGYGIYNNIKNGETFSIISLFFVITGLLMVTFFSINFSRSRKKIREIEATVPRETLRTERRLDIYATLVLIFGVIALICLVWLLIVVGIPQEEGGELLEIISENQTQVIILSSLFIFFVIITFFTYRKLKKIKKEFRESQNLPSS